MIYPQAFYEEGDKPMELECAIPHGHLLSSSSIDIRHYNTRTFAGQTQRCGAANPPVTSGDNRYLVGQLHNASPLCYFSRTAQRATIMARDHHG
jgi:hypothetical protein